MYQYVANLDSQSACTHAYKDFNYDSEDERNNLNNGALRDSSNAVENQQQNEYRPDDNNTTTSTQQIGTETWVLS